jgi:hypothetical protein
MTTTDRRSFVTMTAGAVLAVFLPSTTARLCVQESFSPVMAGRIRAMREALSAFKETTDPLQYDAVAHARTCVELVFMTPTCCAGDEAGVMMALDAYEDIYPYAFAMQTARDLFTPRRYQTYSRERLRHWLLTDPDEEFVKSGMPGFLREMRARYRSVPVSL